MSITEPYNGCKDKVWPRKWGLCSQAIRFFIFFIFFRTLEKDLLTAFNTLRLQDHADPLFTNQLKHAEC